VVDIERSKLARAFGISIFTTNWISTIGVVYFTRPGIPIWVGAVALLLRVSMALTIPGTPGLHNFTPPFLGSFPSPSRFVISCISFQMGWHPSWKSRQSLFPPSCGSTTYRRHSDDRSHTIALCVKRRG
jgi:hypothetical protein